MSDKLQEIKDKCKMRLFGGADVVFSASDVFWLIEQLEQAQAEVISTDKHLAKTCVRLDKAQQQVEVLKESLTAVIEGNRDTVRKLESDVEAYKEEAKRYLLHNQKLVEALTKAEEFMVSIMEFHGQGLVVHNWHQNGDGEPWETFFDENMDGDEIEIAQKALGYSVQGEVQHGTSIKE